MKHSLLGTGPQRTVPQNFKPQHNEYKAGLPRALKAGIEYLSGLAMDDVAVYFNSSKPARVKAAAYAHGATIYIGPGQERYLPHEAWHIVQQKQGRVQPTREIKKGLWINDDKVLEKEADVMS